MASLTISQIQIIKEHMTYDDSILTKKFRAKRPHTIRSLFCRMSWRSISQKDGKKFLDQNIKQRSKSSNRQEEGLRMIFGVCFITLVLDT